MPQIQDKSAERAKDMRLPIQLYVNHHSLTYLMLGQMDLAESDENGNENERGNENENWNEKENGRQPYFMRMRMAYYIRLV